MAAAINLSAPKAHAGTLNFNSKFSGVEYRVLAQTLCLVVCTSAVYVSLARKKAWIFKKLYDLFIALELTTN